MIGRIGQSLLATVAAVAVLSAAAISVGVLLRLTIPGAMALYFIVWWVVLFAILPLRARSQADAGEITAGTDPGAPAVPALNERAIWTTIAAAVVFMAVVVLFPLAGL